MMVSKIYEAILTTMFADIRERKRKEYELGYEEGYDAGFDGFADSDCDSEEEE